MRLLSLWALLVYGLLVRTLAGGLLPASPQLSVIRCRVDINHAGVAELAALPAIGPTRAEQIVLHRIRHGPFGCLEDLQKVHGFGPMVVQDLGPHLRF